MRNSNNDFMKVSIKEAVKGMNKGEIPVGAVIVKDGIIISKAHNLKEISNDVTAHAEILAIREAAKVIGDWRLNGCEMYVTLEPCSMCASAIIQSRISKVYIGAFNNEMGACGSIINLLDNRYMNSFVPVEWLYDEDCMKLITEFFENARDKS